MALTHEQAVQAGRKGGLARKKNKVKRYDAILQIRMPKGLKEWYERRAVEQGVSVSTLTREILQGNRAVMSGKKPTFNI